MLKFQPFNPPQNLKSQQPLRVCLVRWKNGMKEVSGEKIG